MRDELKLEKLRESRDAAKAASFHAIGRLVARLQEELSGDRLRGLPNLGGRRERRLNAALVRARSGAHLEPYDEPPDTWTLVLTERGELIMARWVGGQWETRNAMPDELMAEDAEKLANTIQEALVAHLQRVDGYARRFDSIRRFAERLYDVCEYE